MGLRSTVCVESHTHNAAEDFRLVHSKLRQELAVKLDVSLAESMHETGISSALLPSSGVDPKDPKATEEPLALPPVTVGVLQCFCYMVLSLSQ